LKRSRFTEEQIIGVLKEHRTGLSSVSLTVRSPPSSSVLMRALTQSGQPKRVAAQSNNPVVQTTVENNCNGERSISVPSYRTPLASKCSGRRLEDRNDFMRLQVPHQIGAVIRFREHWPLETASDTACSSASAQPRPHNP
jgi:hypothetical protein